MIMARKFIITTTSAMIRIVRASVFRLPRRIARMAR